MRVLFLHDLPVGESLGVSALIGSLNAAGHKADVLIAGMENDLESALVKLNPDLFAISLVLGVHQNLIVLGRWLKKRFPNVPIVVGGPYMVINPQIIEQPWVDFAAQGEADILMPSLCDALEGKSKLEEIDGLLYKTDGEIKRNPLKRLIDPLDALPLPDRSPYYKYKALKLLSTKRFLTGRGCPNSCKFCYNEKMRRLTHGLGRYTRKKSPQRFIEEIRLAEKLSSFKLIHFSDDVFFINHEWLEDFLKLYRREVHKPFVCNQTGNLVDTKIAAALAEAGCIGVGIGLETGNERLRMDILGKRITNEQYLAAAEAFHDVGIKVFTYNMMALPGESIKQVLETLHFNDEMGSDYVQMLITTPFKGLPLTDWGLENGYLDSEYDMDEFVADTIPIMKQTFFKCERPDAMLNFRDLFPIFYDLSFSPETINRIIGIKPNPVFRFLGKMAHLNQLRSYYRTSISSGIFMLTSLLIAKRRYALHLAMIKKSLGEY